MNVSTKTRTVKVSTLVYIPTYSFGDKNGDGKNWQIWTFNGSNIYDWTDTYVDNYLKEQFKIQAYKGGFYCSQCLQRGIFNHDPEKGFETTDLKISSLENNPQNNGNGITYTVSIQWDPLGYTYTISHGDIVDATGHTNVPNINNNMWVGWDGSYNNFKNFPSGYWQDPVPYTPFGRTGGSDMILKPYPIYKESDNEDPKLSLPTDGERIGVGINNTSGRENLTKFNFEIIYTNKDNTPPENILVNIFNKETGESFSVPMDQSSDTGEHSDGIFSNGESYVTEDFVYDIGNYEYYFKSNELRIPKEGFLNFSVVPSSYKYIPKYSFGPNNGDGRDWQAWIFSGSNIYDWRDTYKNGFLHEKFKIQAYKGGFYCSQCLQRGIFNHNPEKGFETEDLIISRLENNPQNNMDGLIYEVSIQWDDEGYTYSIYNGNAVYATGHTDVPNMNRDMWVGWDGSYNNFKNFPSGYWQYPVPFAEGMTGGIDMILKPFPIYDPVAQNEEPDVPPAPDPVKSSLKVISSFNLSGLTPVVSGTVNESSHTVNLSVPYGTNITSLSPTISISDKANVSPSNLEPKDFTTPVFYTVTAEDGSTQSYTVIVTILPNPNPTPDPKPEEYVEPKIVKYLVNGAQDDITINPKIDNVTIELTSNKNVNWLSIKIEKEDNPTLHKMFLSDTKECVDGESSCTKIWSGETSGDNTLLLNGNYKVRARIKDEKNKEYELFLPPVITVIGQSL